MKHTEEDKALLSEVKRTLDQQADALDFPIQSRLTQARFHAIDRGFLDAGFKDFRHYLSRGVVAFCVVAFISGLGLATVPVLLNKNNFNLDTKGLAPDVLFHHGDITVDSSEDTPEEIEIYNWLYEQYG